MRVRSSNTMSKPDDDPYVDAKFVPVGNLRAPPFSPDQPTLWFAQVDALFRINGIVTELDKFYHIVPLIDTRYALEIADIITNVPTSNPYQTLKNALTARFSKSKEAKLKQLLDGEQIGDRKPSQFLRHLRALVPGIDEDVLRSRWMSSLPDQTKALLTVQSDQPLNKLAEIADKVHEVFDMNQKSTSAVTATPSTSTADTSGQIAALTNQIAKLTKLFSNQRRSNSKDRSQNRSRSRSRQRCLNKDEICYYHQKFGKNAKKCSPGCKYQKNGQENH